MKWVQLRMLLGFAISLHHILAQNPPGFISLDCGLRESSGYDDPIIGLSYSSDEGVIESGESKRISPEFTTNSLARQFLNVRSFPDGSRNCYTLKAEVNGRAILLRGGFMYGNYDDRSKLPEFDLHLGVDYWDTVTFDTSSSVYYSEIVHIPSSEYLQVCAVNTGRGIPFISLLELRPINLMYNTTSGSLQLLARWDLGATARDVLRYKHGDPYDRIWTPANLENATTLTATPNSNFIQNIFSVPAQVMATAAQPLTKNQNLVFSVSPNNSSDQVYFYFHFAELTLSSNQSREMNIYLNDDDYYSLVIPRYLRGNTIRSTGAYSSSSYRFEIEATSNSSLPPMLNAFEAYSVKQFPRYQTMDTDVSAIINIKSIFAIKRNWQGDPCSPQNFAWIGINCSYNGFQPPNIISLNLSSSGLVGTIASPISNLTMLQSLDLSFNNLTGEVPDFLAQLPSLRYLYLQGNEFTDSLPPALLEKSRNGSLVLSFGIPPTHTNCGNDACKSKNNTTGVIPIVASVAAFVAILIISTVSCMIIRRKRQDHQRAFVESNTINGRDAFIEPRLTQFTFAEVLNMIREKKVVGEGGFGIVYRGLVNGVEVAVKILKVSLDQATRDLQSEVKVLAKVHHKNLIRILGYCNEGINRAIIFELLENGSLKKYLSESSPMVLSWELRLYIMIDAAQGLEYLHHGCTPPIIHRDIKPENILLTKEFEAKLADFGLSRIFPAQTTREVGTPGYYENEYSEVGVLSEKMDVYSFGVVVLVVVTGKPAITEGTHITQWIASKIGNGDIRGIVDPRLHGNYDLNVAWKVVELGMACVSGTTTRPNMHDVVRELNGCLQTQGRGLGHSINGTLRLPSHVVITASRPSVR